MIFLICIQCIYTFEILLKPHWKISDNYIEYMHIGILVITNSKLEYKCLLVIVLNEWPLHSFSCQKEVGGGGSDIAFWTFLKSVLVQRHELWDKESPHILKRDWDENSRAKYWWMPRDRKMEDYRNKGRKKASPRMSGKEWTNRRLGKAPLTPTCEWILSNGWYGKYWYLVFSKLPPSSTLRTSILLNT